MSARSYSMEATTRHHVLLNRYANNTVKENLHIVLGLTSDIRDAISTPGDLVNAQILAGKLDEIDRVINVALGQLEDNLRDEMGDLSRNEVAFYNELLERTANASAVGLMAIPANEIIEGIVDRPMKLLKGNGKVDVTINQAIKKMGGRYSSTVKNLINTGIVSGKDRGQIAREVGSTIGRRAKGEVTALVRTTVFHVSGESRNATYQANRDIIDYELWDSVLDGNTTITCADLDGSRFPVGSGPQTPIHWNCRSSRVAVLKKEYQVLGLEGKRPAKGAEGGSRVDSRTTYAGWLKRQPAAFQNKVLGVQRAKLLRSGGLELSDLTSDNGAVINLRELRASNPLAFEKAGI